MLISLQTPDHAGGGDGETDGGGDGETDGGGAGGADGGGGDGGGGGGDGTRCLCRVRRTVGE